MPGQKTITFTLNGEKRTFQSSPDEKLLDLLRRHGYKGTKFGCGEGSCGVCTVIMDGRAVLSCLLHAFQAEGRDVRTIEGVARPDQPSVVARAFVEEDGFQCGYCTPGQVMAAVGLLAQTPQPTAEDIRQGMSGNLCRCGAYPHIHRAVARAAENQRGGRP